MKAFDRLFEIHDGKSQLDGLFRWSLKRALKQQKLWPVVQQLHQVLPDISNQYSNPDGMNCLDPESEDFAPLFDEKVRAQHAFQVDFALEVIRKFKLGKPLTIVDVGDSSGNHLRYLEALMEKEGLAMQDALSVNLDPKAIEKIQASGRKALLCRAENLHEHDIAADFMLSFEMLEHLLDPITFLRQLSQQPPTKAFIMTVPFLRQSRLGMHHIRLDIRDWPADPEDVHILELSSEDWKLLAQFSGWKVIAERVFYQYPRFPINPIWPKMWRKYEYEGFLGLALVPDKYWADLYTGW